jgi:hypothetical protein
VEIYSISDRGGEMKTRYRYIHFVETEELVNNKKVWNCLNNKSKDILAKIFYYSPWKEYCCTQADSGIVFNDGCLADIIDFIRQLNEGLK